MRHDCTAESPRKLEMLRHIFPQSLGSRRPGLHRKEVEEAPAKYKKEIADLTAGMATVKENNKARKPN